MWTHPGGFATYHEARRDRFARFEELRRRWDEEHAKLKALVLMYKKKAAYNDGMASRYQAAQTRLRKFEEAGPPTAQPREQQVKMRLKGGRTGKRAVVCEGLELTGLMKPFDLEVWYGERVAVLGSNGSGKSHFLRLLAAGGSDPDVEHRPVGERAGRAGRAHRQGQARRPGAARLVRADPRAPRAGRPHAAGDPAPRRRRTATACRASRRRRALDRYELAHAAEQRFESLSGGQQARFQILLLELSGATLLLLDEPTDNLDVESAEALEEGLERVRGHGARGHPRPLVRPRLRPLPGLRRRRLGLRVRRPGLGRGPGHPRPLALPLLGDAGAVGALGPADQRAGEQVRDDPATTPAGDLPLRGDGQLGPGGERVRCHAAQEWWQEISASRRLRRSSRR